MEFIMTAKNTNTLIDLNEPTGVNEMAKKFNNYAKKTAESVLQMAKVVSDMKARRNKVEFEEFCDLIRYKSDSSLIRKFAQIGSKFNQLMANADKLPNTWTTVYQIAKLSEDTISELMDKGVINPHFSGKDARKFLGLSKSKAVVVAYPATDVVPNGTVNEYSFKARLPSFPRPEVREQLKRILNELKEINFEVEENESLQNLFNDTPQALAA
jgi:hypothetical protein